MKKAFTLAEVMIVLTVIGILAGILIPVANNSRPDENVMKFKKAHATLANVIHELVTSDKYYCNGDLAIHADCKTQVQWHGDYFCKTIADLLTVKKLDCALDRGDSSIYEMRLLSNEFVHNVATGSKVKREVTASTISATKDFFDEACRVGGKKLGMEIETTDGVVYYQASNSASFATARAAANEINGLEHDISLRFFSPPNEFPANYADQNGFDIAYKIYCIDIDGIPDNVTETDCVNECPFGYGIRADGKILTGARADEWLEKDFQKGKNDN